MIGVPIVSVNVGSYGLLVATGNVLGVDTEFGVKGKVMDCVIINDKTYNVTVKRYAYPVKDYLCAVSIDSGYKIYRTKQGKPFIGTLFATLEDCLGAIKVFYEVYGEYFPIWENNDWVDANIPALCQWSIKNGINLYKFVQDTEAHGQPIRCSSLYQGMA